MIPILHYKQKEQVNKFVPEIFKPKKFLKQKGTSNKFAPEIFSFS